MNLKNLKIRDAEKEDIPFINKIYNEAIKETVATFDIKTKSLKEQENWFNQHSKGYPIIVSELENIVIGWASLSKWSDKKGYDKTAEISLYIEKNYQKQGIGRILLDSLIKKGRETKLKTIIALITEGNKPSVKIHEELGFVKVGILRKVGYKFGKYLDVIIMQKLYIE